MSIPETPSNRLEMYLDEIARNGGGGGGGGGSSTLSGLTDVDLTNPTDGQTLVYNATSGKWENRAGGVFVVHHSQGVLDKTWAEITAAMESGNVVQLVHTVSSGGQEETNVMPCSNYRISDLGDEVYYLVSFYDLYNQMTDTFVASSAGGYPVYADQ